MSGFSSPGIIEGPAAWRSDQLTPGEWVHDLDPAEVGEIEQAARALAAADLDLTKVGPADFPLPLGGSHMREILLKDVLEGRGFAVVRGLAPERLDRSQIAAAFIGLAAYWGALRPQNAAGHVLGHVKDLGRSSADPTARLYQTHERQTYHTDSCDVVALMCLQPAKAGGRSSLVSSVTIHNEMQRRAPDLAARLFQPIETDRRGEEGPGERPWFSIPVFNWHAGRFAGIYQRQYIESARRFEGVAPLSKHQIAALDLLDQLVEDPCLHLELDFQPGDIQLVNNHVLFHDRTQFEDWPQPERRRHLLRLWLAPDQAQILPPVFAERFGSLVQGQRGGVAASPDKWVAPLDVV